MNHYDAEIVSKTRDDEVHVDLWRVRGIPDRWYPTKLVAEAAARARFPYEDPDYRYNRITYRIFVS